MAKRIEQKMQEYSEKQEYELAGNYRDLMRTVEDLNTRPKLISYALDDADIFGYARNEENISVQIFFMRNGQIVGRHEFFFESKLVTDGGSLVSDVLMQFYGMPRFLPGYIYVQQDFPDRESLEQILSKKKGQRVRVLAPSRGKKRELVQLVVKNAKISLDINSESGRVRSHETLRALQETVQMGTLPYRIEAFDISNTQGTNSVASMVVWEGGRRKKSDYRKYKIRGVVGPDDFRSMAEVIERRISHLQKNQKPMPDLILVDGGKGQLSAAYEVLTKHNLQQQPIMGLAKREEEIFLPNRSDSIKLDHRSPVLKLIQQVRDEAHRFAITFHRSIRAKKAVEMSLDEIPGIGARRKEQVLQHFGSFTNLQKASLEQIQEILGQKTGSKLYSSLHGENTQE